jgi:hypothetical protein
MYSTDDSAGKVDYQLLLPTHVRADAVTDKEIPLVLKFLNNGCWMSHWLSAKAKGAGLHCTHACLQIWRASTVCTVEADGEPLIHTIGHKKCDSIWLSKYHRPNKQSSSSPSVAKAGSAIF